MAEQATQNIGYNLSLFGDMPAVPDENTLLSLKMLKEVNREAFEGLAQEQTRFLTAALALLKQDHFLRIKLGGAGLQQAMILAQILKKRAEEKHIQSRIDVHSDAIQSGFLTAEMNNALPPVYRPVLKWQDGNGDTFVGAENFGANL